LKSSAQSALGELFSREKVENGGGLDQEKMRFQRTMEMFSGAAEIVLWGSGDIFIARLEN